MTARQYDGSIQAVLDDIGARAWVHGIDLDHPEREVVCGADDPVVAASVFKLPVLVEMCRQISVGTLAGEQRVRIGADERRTLGGIGLSVMLDEVELSLRDLAVLMMSVSDNRATDVICDLVGLDAVATLLQQLDLPGTVIPGDCQWLFDSIEQDMAGQDWDAIEPGPDDPRLSVRAVTPLETIRTTPRESTTLLGKLWRDEDLPADACALARHILGLQVWPHRLATAFPDDSVKLSGKTGTFGPVRNEVGVAEFPDGQRLAIAVFLNSGSASGRQRDADRAIGRIGAVVVEQLRTR